VGLTMSKKIVLRYIGEDVYYVSGVPARDLTAAEAEQYGGVEKLAAYKDSYEVVDVINKPKTSDKEGK
jgi:hypothetical protein